MRTLKVPVAILLCLGAPARGAEPGFALHGELGAGYARSQATRNGFSQSVGGLGVPHALMVGWAARSGWVMGAEYWGTFAYGPRLQTRGPGSGSGLTYRVHGFGPSVRCPLPADLFVAATPSLTRITLSDNDANGFKWKWGFGLRVAAGREWQMSERWTLGAAAVVQLGLNAQDEPASPRWNTIGAGAVLTFGLR